MEQKQFTVTKKANELSDCITEVTDEILKEVIQCEHAGQCNEQCALAFKFIPQELAFYRRMNVPLPRLCHNCRNSQRLQQGRPYRLWNRECQCAGTRSENGSYTNIAAHAHGEDKCSNAFATAYAPEQEEIVYCADCYATELE